MERFPIPKVGLSVKWGLSYCPKYDRYNTCNMCHGGQRSYRSLIEFNEMISYACVLRVAPLYSQVYVDENRHRFEVSVSKAHFIPQTPSYSDYGMIRKRSAMIVEHALYCHNCTAHAPQSLQCTQNVRTYF